MDSEQPEPAAEGGAEEVMRHCPNCSARLEDRGCKLRCPRCGYFMSCSDYV